MEANKEKKTLKSSSVSEASVSEAIDMIKFTELTSKGLMISVHKGLHKSSTLSRLKVEEYSSLHNYWKERLQNG